MSVPRRCHHASVDTLGNTGITSMQIQMPPRSLSAPPVFHDRESGLHQKWDPSSDVENMHIATKRAMGFPLYSGNESQCMSKCNPTRDHHDSTTDLAASKQQRTVVITFPMLRESSAQKYHTSPERRQRRLEMRLKPRQQTRLQTRTTWEMTSTVEDLVKEIKKNPYLSGKVYYEAWYFSNLELSRKRLQQLRVKEKEEKERNEQEAMKKKLENESAYRCWKAKKTKELDIKQKQQQKRKAERQKEIEARQEKSRDAELAFKFWKKRKDAELQEKQRKEYTAKIEKQMIDDDNKWEKQQAAVAVYEAWKKSKENQSAQKKKRLTRLGEQSKRDDEEQRENEAKHAYLTWLNHKEAKHDSYINQSRFQQNPWYPPSKTR